MTLAMIVWHLIGAWVFLVAVGAAWFQGFSSGKAMGEVLGADRVRKIYEPFSRLQDHGEQ